LGVAIKVAIGWFSERDEADETTGLIDTMMKAAFDDARRLSGIDLEAEYRRAGK
jgi:hypothetical protein